MSCKSYHLVGVGGVGMSALGYLLALRGYTVSGSDRTYDSTNQKELAIFTKLKKAGIELFRQDGSGIGKDTHCLVISTAIEDDNPDIQKAKRLNIPIKHRTDILKEMCEGKFLIGITGTAGKTTVTGMLGWILERVGLAPTIVNGGEVVNWTNDEELGSTRAGDDKLWVLELDESDKTLLKFSPDWAIITNITKDHFELDELYKIFNQFAAQVKKGVITLNDIPEITQVSATGSGSYFTLRGINCHIQMLGKHNIQNAAFALMASEKLGVSLKSAVKALSEFKGIKRRLELIGSKNDITIIDDYAHNPAKIIASIEAVKPLFNRILAVWRPHGFAPLKLMLKELAASFSKTLRSNDALFLLQPYYAGGTVSKDVDAYDLKKAILEHKVEFCINVVETYDELKSSLLTEVATGNTILLMGARDPFLPLFAGDLLRSL